MCFKVTIVHSDPMRKRIHKHIETMLDIYIDMQKNPTTAKFRAQYFYRELDQLLQFCDYSLSESDQFEICLLWQLVHNMVNPMPLVWPIQSKFYTRER